MALFELDAQVECLYSTVRNISTTERFFGFLPPHGRRLACGEEMTVWGDIQTWLTRFTPNDRARRSLEGALRSTHDIRFPHEGVLALVKTPAVHLYDATLDVTKIITLANGTFVDTDPCWGDYSSVSIDCTDDSDKDLEAKEVDWNLETGQLHRGHLAGEDADGNQI